MPLLDDIELKKIEDKLALAEISHESLSVDLVDHICCMIEERLDLGFSIDKAEAEVFKEMGAVQLKSIEIETQKLTQNKFIMKKRTKIIGWVALIITLTGLIFKLLHLQGAGVLWGVGILTFAFGFFLMILVDRFSYEKDTKRRIVTAIGYVGAAALLIGIGLALLRWFPISTYLAEGGGILLLVYFVITNTTPSNRDKSSQ